MCRPPPRSCSPTYSPSAPAHSWKTRSGAGPGYPGAQTRFTRSSAMSPNGSAITGSRSSISSRDWTSITGSASGNSPDACCAASASRSSTTTPNEPPSLSAPAWNAPTSQHSPSASTNSIASASPSSKHHWAPNAARRSCAKARRCPTTKLSPSRAPPWSAPLRASQRRTSFDVSRIARVSLGVALALPIVGLVVLLSAPSTDVHWEHHPSHFWLVLAAAVVPALLGWSIGTVACRRADARLLLVSLAFVAAAVFLGLHALATPKVLLEKSNAGFVLAVPVGLFIASVFAAWSALHLRSESAHRIVACSWMIRGALLALALGWAV